ncbi:unnamed protein product [Prorocentrum cordatum]|uniref:Uncharacterized protein n=1 Tax=Prorocentrum cordatum TaxID=2364126 RepID=A0ABN9XGJ3_9DINO|nr:unnamed protein product [Polarella glacialis]
MPRRCSLLWCAGAQGCDDEEVHSMLRRLPPLEFHRTSSEVEFARWLFAQPRGTVTPSSILVTGWREAKPCMAAIRAARTGETGNLRKDGRRPRLPAATPDRGALNGVAVGAMVIMVQKPAQESRARTWLSGEDASSPLDPALRVGVVVGTRQLEATLSCLAGALGLAAAPARPPPPAPPAKVGLPILATSAPRASWSAAGPQLAGSQPPASPCAALACGAPPASPGSTCAAGSQRLGPCSADSEGSTRSCGGSDSEDAAADASPRPRASRFAWSLDDAQAPKAGLAFEDLDLRGSAGAPLHARPGGRAEHRAGDHACRARSPSLDYLWWGFSSHERRALAGE